MNNQDMINQWYMQQTQQNAANTVLYSCMENCCTSTPLTANDVVLMFGILIAVLIFTAILLFSMSQD